MILFCNRNVTSGDLSTHWLMSVRCWLPRRHCGSSCRSSFRPRANEVKTNLGPERYVTKPNKTQLIMKKGPEKRKQREMKIENKRQKKNKQRKEGNGKKEHQLDLFEKDGVRWIQFLTEGLSRWTEKKQLCSISDFGFISSSVVASFSG